MRGKFSLLVRIVLPIVIFCCAAFAGALNPVPFLNQPLVPSSVVPGTAGFTLTLNGTGFVQSSIVKWDQTVLATTFVSGTQLTASVPAAKLAKAGTGSVTVVNPAPGGGISNVDFFQVANPSPAVGFSRSDLNIPLTSLSIAVNTADFNRDGKLDLAVADGAHPGVVFIFLGNGDGTFQSPVSYAAGQGPISLSAGDFNGDGIPDLAVADLLDNTVSILLGNGDGTFEAALGYATSGYPSVVMCGDFSGDGKLDVVLTSSNQGGFSILLGNGDGSFQPFVSYLSKNGGASSLNIGDFNGDGKLDVVVATSGSTKEGVSVFLGNGDGTFQSPAKFATALGPTSVEVADFNGDGRLDLAVGTGAGISLLLGNGDGTFKAPLNYSPSEVVASLTSGDFNGDGELDLAFSVPDSIGLFVMLGNGDGTFQAATEFAALSAPSSLAKGDFNRDGTLDLVSGEGTNFVAVLLSTAANLSTNSLFFGPQTINTVSAGQNIILTNTSGLTLTIGSVEATGNFSQTNNCGTGLSPGANCTITVTFDPQMQGTQVGKITIMDSATPNRQTITLTGVGTVVGLSHWALAFPPEIVGVTSPPLSTTLTNVGSANISFMGWSITGANPGDFIQSDNCGFRLTPGQSCTFRLTFTPGATGSRTASLNLYDGGGGSPQMVTLSGTGK